MERKFNTTVNNQRFNSELILSVWNKRNRHQWGENWGTDKFGNLIKYEEYGKATKKYGWDIDHSKPVSAGGKDHLNNLQPLQSYYNRHVKADNFPWSFEHHDSYFRGFSRRLKK